METSELIKAVLLIVGALGAFLVGMEILQSATEKLATTGLKRLFAKTSKNPFVGLGIGTLATMIMQSSGATTVMVVGFVNAGVMSLAQATAYIMGANIGTTITAQIVALGNLPISQVMIALTLFGVILKMIFSKKHEKVADIGLLIVGLGLLFLGLEVMTGNMKSIINSTPVFTDFLASLDNPFLLLFIGIIATAAVQSSSAITSIVIAMALAGATIGSGGNAVLYLILGTNIGSTATALLSAIGSTTNGKRAAVIHFLFNVFGSILFFIVLVLVPNFNDYTFNAWFKDSPQTSIAMFHTFFNVACTIIFLPLTKFFVKLATLIIPEKKEKKPENIDEMIDERFLKNTAIAYSQAIKYYHIIAKMALDDLNLSIDAFVNRDTEKKQQIDDIEAEVLRMTRNLTGFIVKIQSLGVAEEVYSRLSKMQLDIADIVRLTEVADNITGYTAHEVNESLSFSKIVYEQIGQMKKLLNEQFVNTELIVENPTLELLEKTGKLEDEIDDLRTNMVHSHMERLSKGECQPQNSNIYVNLVGNLERCGDHFNFICERACSTISKATSTHA
jgi:phosphate:Na+ symporter